jgi:hypothetical protein
MLPTAVPERKPGKKLINWADLPTLEVGTKRLE